MKEIDFYERATRIGKYIVEHQATIRATGVELHLGKTTIHSEIHRRLKECDMPLYQQTVAVLGKNSAEKQQRGGYARQKKLRQEKHR